MRVGVLVALELALGLFEEVGKFPGVTDVAVTLELNTDLDGAVSPDVAANAPVERVLKVSSVERLDVGLVCLRECRCGRR